MPQPLSPSATATEPACARAVLCNKRGCHGKKPCAATGESLCVARKTQCSQKQSIKKTLKTRNYDLVQVYYVMLSNEMKQRILLL